MPLKIPESLHKGPFDAKAGRGRPKCCGQVRGTSRMKSSKITCAPGEAKERRGTMPS